MLKKPIKIQWQKGFSLIEILVGLVIGLVVALVITQTFSLFEGQKRTTSRVANTQTNGSIALYNIIRDVQMAGFGLPLLDSPNSPIACSPAPSIDHDNNGGTAAIDLFPIVITDGGGGPGASDSVASRYGFVYQPLIPAARRQANVAGLGVVQFPGNPGTSVTVTDPNNATTPPGLAVRNNRGCQNGDIALLSIGGTCMLAKVTASNASLDADTTHIQLDTLVPAPTYSNASISCLGRWDEITYRVNNGQLGHGGQSFANNDAIVANRGVPNAAFRPNVSDIVNIQAQYGISVDASSNTITQWVDATGAWAAPVFPAQNQIKAVHIAVVARSDLLEKTNVTTTCTTLQGTVNNGPCAWNDAGIVGAAPKIDLSNDLNWQRYRYRVFDTIIPIRNLVWAK